MMSDQESSEEDWGTGSEEEGVDVEADGNEGHLGEGDDGEESEESEAFNCN